MPTPELVKVHPIVGLASCNNKHGLGYALWSLARGIDNGSGKIDVEVLRAATKELRWPGYQWRRALQQAYDAKMFTEGNGWLYLTSLQNLALHYELDTVGAYPVMVKTESMRRLSAWKSVLWSGYHASRGEKNGSRPISRQRLEILTSVNPRTQRRLDPKAKIQKTKTFKAISPNRQPEVVLRMTRDENTNKRYFRKGGRIWTQASNIYHSELVTAKRGSCHKIRRLLKHALLTSHGGQRISGRKVFYFSKAEAEKAAIKLSADPGMMDSKTIIYWKFFTLPGGSVLFLPIE